MSHHFERGRLLYTQGRYALAADEFRAALADDPNRAEPHSYLAQCFLELGDTAGALREADEGVRLAPLHFLPHTVKAMVLHKMDRYAEAEASATEAVSNDPFAAWPFAVLANVRFSRNDWAGCLEAATRGLALDPTDAGCLSLRTLANLRLGRRADAAFSAETALRNDPNDPFAHVAEGWRRMHVGDAKGACEHFRTALRLDPTSAAARAGMIEALKARYWVYRQMVRFQLWMARLGAGGQVAVLIGLLLLPRLLGRVADENPVLVPVLVPLLIAVAVFAVLTWAASGVFNLALLFHPLGRQALTRGERREGWWTGGCLLTAVVAVVGWAFAPDLDLRYGRDVLRVLAQDLLMTAIAGGLAVCGWYRAATGWPKRVLTLVLGAVTGLFGVSVFILADGCSADSVEEFRASVRAYRELESVAEWRVLAVAVLVNYLLLRHPQRGG